MGFSEEQATAIKRYQEGFHQVAVDRARIKTNKAVSKFVQAQGGIVIRHSDFDNRSSFWGEDGVHLNENGSDLFNFNIG
ncbi:hypothetical protein XELAEV_18033388mg [Xenopus laevis]|uniref:Uncharacterized protein n=1 Tax=Xenopus laevis TaxID=8355 RepID=A0A974CKA4_XENLA|nr:hypothetical protein XELAEV_18033388mg [Xenopus laevis]